MSFDALTFLTELQDRRPPVGDPVSSTDVHDNPPSCSPSPSQKLLPFNGHDLHHDPGPVETIQHLEPCLKCSSSRRKGGFG